MFTEHQQRMRDLIKEGFKITYAPEFAKVICRDAIHYGIFEYFDDSIDLDEQEKYRLIPNNNAIAYKKECDETKLSNPKYSIVIDVKNVLDVVHTTFEKEKALAEI